MDCFVLAEEEDLRDFGFFAESPCDFLVEERGLEKVEMHFRSLAQLAWLAAACLFGLLVDGFPALGKFCLSAL